VVEAFGRTGRGGGGRGGRAKYVIGIFRLRRFVEDLVMPDVYLSDVLFVRRSTDRVRRNSEKVRRSSDRVRRSSERMRLSSERVRRSSDRRASGLGRLYGRPGFDSPRCP
jgi:hypothetical protein